jgi:TrmH family RNA methyltransferase
MHDEHGSDQAGAVDPPKDDNQEALKLAAGADQIVLEAAVVKTLAEAIEGRNLVIGTSRHPGRLRKNIRSPREMAEQIAPLLSRNTVAIVFGNEVNGLENRDLALCQEIVAIPSSDAFPSLNLSHAVMIVAYELFLACRTGVSPMDRELAQAEDLERFYRHLQETLQDVGFLDPAKPDRMMATLRQIYGRSRLEERDVAILRGILSAVDRTRARKP